MGRHHDRACFYKYASRSTALRVIEGKSFRWSSPTKFNDPFDHQISLVLDGGKDEFARTLTASAVRLIFGNTLPDAVSSSAMGFLIRHLHKDRRRLRRREVLPHLRYGSREVAEGLDDHLAGLSSALQVELCHARVFCVSEVRDNVVMWSHYSEEHRGVVFKLKCDDDLDNTLLAAKKVNYTDSFVRVPAETYAKQLTGEQPFDLQALVWQMAYTKHYDWSYEREWRVHMPLLSEPEGDGYTFLKEDSRIFEEIYLGCRMPDEEAAEIISAVRTHLPETRVFRAVQGRRSFSLHFEEVN